MPGAPGTHGGARASRATPFHQPRLTERRPTLPRHTWETRYLLFTVSPDLIRYPLPSSSCRTPIRYPPSHVIPSLIPMSSRALPMSSRAKPRDPRRSLAPTSLFTDTPAPPPPSCRGNPVPMGLGRGIPSDHRSAHRNRAQLHTPPWIPAFGGRTVTGVYECGGGLPS